MLEQVEVWDAGQPELALILREACAVANIVCEADDSSNATGAAGAGGKSHGKIEQSSLVAAARKDAARADAEMAESATPVLGTRHRSMPGDSNGSSSSSSENEKVDEVKAASQVYVNWLMPLLLEAVLLMSDAGALSKEIKVGHHD